MTNIDMVEAVRMLAADNGISVDTLLQVLADALVSAYKRRPGRRRRGRGPDRRRDDGHPHLSRTTSTSTASWSTGATTRPTTWAASPPRPSARCSSQRIREVERERKFEEYANREGDIVTGIVQQIDNRYTLLDLGKVEALLPQAEQVPFERPEPGARLKAYIVEVRRTSKGPQIVVSRTHPGLIKRLFELEVPEIADGVVEIKACAREPGHRTKIAVWSNDHNVDPVGACVGARGARVRMVVTELRGEKIDIVPFSEDQPDFVAKALSPAKVKEVRIHEDTGVAEVIVPDYQLSLAIGKEGQNARLAARLTGWRVDIKSETQLAEEDAGIYRSDERYDARRTSSTPRASGCPTRQSGELEWHAADGNVVSAEEWAAGDADTAEGEVDAAPTDATAVEAAGATEEAAEEALAEEVAIEADLDPIQDAADAEAADRAAEAEDQGGDEAAASDEEPAGDG